MLLKDKVVYITGAARGIGQGIAQAVALEGARLVITDREAAWLKETQALLDEMHAQALALEADVTDEAQIAESMRRAVQHYGRLDGVVNNAGVFVPEPSISATKEGTAFQFEVNVLGLFSCCQAAARIMKEQPEGGKIVNISSNGGKVGFPGFAPYSASKAAVINLTQTLAKEWAPYKVNVNAVCPGGVDTPMLAAVAKHIAEKSGGEAAEIHKRLCPPQLGRHVQPLEVGRVVAFLLSDYADIIRGQSISIDGGETPF